LAIVAASIAAGFAASGALAQAARLSAATDAVIKWIMRMKVPFAFSAAIQAAAGPQSHEKCGEALGFRAELSADAFGAVEF
jgi:hypothetical protein